MMMAGSGTPRRIWLCADDYGMSPGVNRAMRNLIERGRLNAASVMVGTASVDRTEADALAALNAQFKRVAIGLHVTLTGPFAPLTKTFTPTREGAFLPLHEMARAAILRRLDGETLAAEIAAQFNAFVDLFDRAPDFLDGHQHIHLFPTIRDAFLRVAKQKAPGAWVRQCGRSVPLLRRFADPKALVLDFFSVKFRRRAAELGVRTNPAFAGTYDFTDGADFTKLFPGFLQDLPDGSVVMCHPGFVDAELQRLDPVTVSREREYAFLAGDTFPQVLRAQGIALV